MNFKRFNGSTWETVRHKRYGSGTDSLTTFPAMIQASGEPLTDYTIYGNTGGVGDYVLFPNILENNFQSQEVNGLTITVDGNGFLISGTATISTRIQLYCGLVNHTATAKDFQLIPNGIYEIDGNPADAAINSYILSYTYDNAPGGTPPQNERVPVGEPGILDSSSGSYHYLLVYIAIWSGVTLDNVRFAPTLRRKAYEIPVTSGGVTTNLYTDSPLGLMDTLTYTDTGIALPTFDGDNIISFETEVKPSAMSATFKGWHPMQRINLYGNSTELLTSFPAVIQASGEAMTDYTIYGNTGGVGDKTANLLKCKSVSRYGVDVTLMSDGSLHIYGTPEYSSFTLFIEDLIDALTIGEKYTLSDNMEETSSVYLRIVYADNYAGIGRVSGDKFTFTFTSDIASRGVVVNIAINNASTSELIDMTVRPMLNAGDTALPFELYGYKIPVTSGGVTTNLYIDSPLGLTDTLTYTDTGIALPTSDGDSAISFGTTVQPSAMSATFKGWHLV